MKENTTAKIIKFIGIASIVVCFIGSFIVSNETSNEIIPIVFIVSGVISGVMFIGFGEVINLLQRNADNQEQILRYLTSKPAQKNKPPKTILQDIEDNLPNM